MADWNHWHSLLPDLLVGGAAGAVGAAARELHRTDRQLTWALAFQIVCAIPVGMLVVAAAASFGVEDSRGLVALAIGSGMLGQAVITDAMRALLRGWLSRNGG